MALVQIDETLMARLRVLAAQRQQHVETLIEEALASYLPEEAATGDIDLDSITAAMVEADPSLADLFHARGLPAPGEHERWLSLAGIIDTDVTDMSETIRETLAAATYEYGWTLKGKDDHQGTD